MDHFYWKEQLYKYRTRSLTSVEEALLWDALADTANAEGWKQTVGKMSSKTINGVRLSEGLQRGVWPLHYEKAPHGLSN